ncbi:DeoR/GlpR family DNA-binding transcription regulator [Puniceicoccaceae bacterium K14]|nr:DeoR/GlpR family DNA-binding transcription regulator [Puniceicoccaceae bacterium K14]
MIAANRHQIILDLIESQGSVRTVDLADKLNVTDETIRRDLEKLEQDSLLQRTHGGAVTKQHLNKDRSFEERSIQNIDAKRVIAEAAAALIKPGDRIFLDASSTALQLTTFIRTMSDIVVLTNSALVATELAKNDAIELIIAGGLLDRQSQSYIGPAAIGTLRRYRIDKAFFSGNGIDEMSGISEVNDAQAHIKEFVIPRCGKAILLADPTKLGVSSTYYFAQCEQINTLVTCKDVNHPILDNLQNKGVRLISAG